MSNEPRLWLRDPEPACWVDGVLHRGPLEQLAPVLQGRGARVFVPSEAACLARVEAPPGGRQRLLQAIPYALEDQLADDVERLHFALGDRDETGRLAVVVVARARMEDWLERLRRAGIQYRALHLDLFLLPWQAESWAVTTVGSVALVRTGPADGFACDKENLSEYLRLQLREQKAPPRRLALWLCPDPIALGDLGAAVPVESQRCEHLLALEPEADFSAVPDLAQGDYSPRQRWARLWRPWRLAAGLAALWLTLHLGLLAWDNVRMERQVSDLRAQIEQIYRDTFPDARKVVNPRVQMTRRLERLKQGGERGGDFIALLGRVAPLIVEAGAEVRSVRYKNGTLDVELSVRGLEDLDRLKQRLEQRAGVVAEIQSAAARDGKVQGRLQIEERA